MFCLEEREKGNQETLFGTMAEKETTEPLQQHSVREPGGKFGESHHRRVKDGPEGAEDRGREQMARKGDGGGARAKETKIEELEQSFAASVSRNLVRAVGFYFKNPVKLFRPAVIEVM